MTKEEIDKKIEEKLAELIEKSYKYRNSFNGGFFFMFTDDIEKIKENIFSILSTRLFSSYRIYFDKMHFDLETSFRLKRKIKQVEKLIKRYEKMEYSENNIYEKALCEALKIDLSCIKFHFEYKKYERQGV